jgi:hypothetical protein
MLSWKVDRPSNVGLAACRHGEEPAPFLARARMVKRHPLYSRIVMLSVRTRQLSRYSFDGWGIAARILLFLLVVLIVVTPVTQSVWSGDNFLHGHDDTEFSLLVALGFVSLSLLLCRERKSILAEILSSLLDLLAILRQSLWGQESSAPVHRAGALTCCAASAHPMHPLSSFPF